MMAAGERQLRNDQTQELQQSEPEHGTQSETGGKAKQAVTALRKKFVPGFKYSLLIIIVINFAMLIVGCLNVHNCTVNPSIPFFLIVTGAIGVFVKFLSYVRDRLIKRIKLKYIESCLYFTELVFFFVGTYWTYSAFKPNFDDPKDKYYCNKTAYMFAFIYITFFYVLLLGILVFVCCFIICFCALAGTAGQDMDPESQIPYIDETPSAEERRNEEMQNRTATLAV